MFEMLGTILWWDSTGKIFSLLVISQTDTLDNKPNYDKGREICLISLVDTTNIYFAGEKTLTVQQSAGQSEFAIPQSESNFSAT